MSRALAHLSFGCGVLLFGPSACGGSVAAHSGTAEPIHVTNGEFFEGSFPSDTGGPAIDPPNLVRTNLIPAGITGKKIGGDTAEGSLSIAVAFKGLGSGYWVVPVGPEDPALPGELSWSAVCDFTNAPLPSAESLLFAAGDRSGRFGTTSELRVTMLPFAPTGHVVASLHWGNNADLDLHLISPSGKELDPKHPSTAVLDASGTPSVGGGKLDRDSNANCDADGYRSEDAVWDADAGAPESGTYLVRVDMFNACGVPAADFTFDLFIDGAPIQHRVGRLLDIDADGGGPGSGLYVTEFNL